MSSGTTKGVDVDAIGTINGVSTYDFDLDGIQAEDKPWRKPGQLKKGFLVFTVVLNIILMEYVSVFYTLF